MEIYRIQAAHYEARTALYQGRNHLIVPVVMMTEGVRDGNVGPILHLAEEFGKFAQAWNGRPVTIGHPEVDGLSVSANDPELSALIVGQIFNATFEDGKLKGEAWLDEAKLRDISPQALAYIKDGQPLEISIGVLADHEDNPGEYNGEQYKAIARNHRPDHLALLPGGVGACSWGHGCGVRVNKEGGGNVSEERSIAIYKGGVLMKNDIVINIIGYNEIARKIQAKLDAMDDGTKTHYLVETFNNHFIYRVERTGSETQLFKRNYQAMSNDTIEFIGEAVSVVKEVNYVTMEGNRNMAEEKKEPCCEEKVDALIANEATEFSADDRDWMLGLDKTQLGKVEVLATAKPAENKEAGTPQMNREQAIEVLKSELSDPDKFMQFVPTIYREQMEHGMSLYTSRRKELIDTVTANAKGIYTAEELEGKDIGELEKLSQIVKPKINYSAMGGGSAGDSGEAPLSFPGMTVANNGGKE